ETVWGLRAGSCFGSASCQESCCHTSTCSLTVEETSESAASFGNFRSVMHDFSNVWLGKV
ncbi:Nonribosomal peptide synthetase 1, partial [Clarias magur]